VDGAVNMPVELIVPPVADHVTGLLEPVTVAVNCCVAPAIRLALVGETFTVTGDETVTVALAETPLSVAVTVTVPVVLGAVKSPVELIVPALAVHVGEADVPLTVAVNCWVVPSCRLADVGEIDAVTVAGADAATVTAALDDTPLAVAETAYSPGVVPAVYIPFELTLPVGSVVVHVGAAEVPVTVAAICCVPPSVTLADVGDTATVTGVDCDPDDEPAEHQLPVQSLKLLR
jgi:hypothetical protein